MKKLLFAAAFLLAGAGCARTVPVAAPALPATPETSTIVIDGQRLTLGQDDLRAFGTPVYGDLDGDGDQDAAMLVTQEPGGSGTFFYVAAALNQGNGYQGTNAVFLGDRIAPQNVQIKDGLIIANYADRKPGEPFTTQPSVGVSKYVRVQAGALAETTP